MEYSKPPLTFNEQAELLINRGLQADRASLIMRLQTVNYYRLSGYLYPFKLPDNTYRRGTTLDIVWHHYIFDRQLRVLIMDAVERVEVAIRTQLSYHFSHKYGPFGYLKYENVPNLTENDYNRWLDDLQSETKRSKETFIDHFFDVYGDNHDSLPLWMLIEVMSFGKTLTFFSGVQMSIRKTIAAEYRIPEEILHSWLRSLNAVRNICAHHGRLWNRTLGYKPKLPYKRKHPEWYTPVQIPQDKIFGILTILKVLLKFVAPTSSWVERIKTLINAHKDISIVSMGFPINWKDSRLWKE